MKYNIFNYWYFYIFFFVITPVKLIYTIWQIHVNDIIGVKEAEVNGDPDYDEDVGYASEPTAVSDPNTRFGTFFLK